MKLSSQLLVPFCVLFFAVSGFGQAGCPTVEITAKPPQVEYVFDFVATVKGGPASVSPAFAWTTSKGEVIPGARPNEAFVAFFGAKDGDEIAVGVEVKGYAAGCKVTGKLLHRVKIVAPQCPTLSVSGPTAAVAEGTPATLTLNLSGIDVKAAGVTYNWQLSDGSLVSGQGTNTVSIDTAGTGGKSIKAEVDILGVSPTCKRFTDFTFAVKKTVVSQLIDEFVPTGSKAERSKLETAADMVTLTEGSSLYIIRYEGVRADKNAALKAANSAVSHLRKHMDKSATIEVIDGGYRTETTLEFWLVPTGAARPTPSKTVSKPAEPVKEKSFKARKS